MIFIFREITDVKEKTSDNEGEEKQDKQEEIDKTDISIVVEINLQIFLYL